MKIHDPLRLPTKPLAKRLLLFRLGEATRDLCLAVLDPGRYWMERFDADRELQRKIGAL